VITLPFKTMIQLAQSVTVDVGKLIVIHSTGCCGSTLVGNVFAQLPGRIGVSESDVLTQLVVARFMQPDKQAEL